MSKITIKCHECNSINSHTFEIFLFDEYSLINNIKSNESGELSFELNKIGLYKILLVIDGNYNYKYQEKIFYNNNQDMTIHFYFKNYRKCHLITIDLIDKYYNLPIEKGEVKLWVNHIQ